MYKDKVMRKRLATGLVIFFAAVLLFAIWPYLSGIIGALLLSTIFMPVYKALYKKTRKKRLSAGLVVLIALAVVIVPIAIITPLLYREINNILLNQATLSTLINMLNERLALVDLGRYLPDISESIAGAVRWLSTSFIGSAADAIINIAIAFFTMFYIFVNANKLYDFAQRVIPFKREYNRELLSNFKNITNSTLISTVFIALFQGFLMGLTFYILGIRGAVLWGVVAFVLALFPIVGIPLVWVPASVILFAQGDLTSAVIIAIVGLILSNVDIFIRSWLQNKFGRIHPLVTLLGVIIGVPFFGILGIFFGPILISYFMLMLCMYKDEYL